MNTAQKVRENRIRHMAERRGYTLQRSRRRDPLAVDYGRYWIWARDGIAGFPPDGWTSLDGVERFLNEVRPLAEVHAEMRERGAP